MPAVVSAPASTGMMINNNSKQVVLKLSSDDFDRGDFLGKGSFASVYEMTPLSASLLNYNNHQPLHHPAGDAASADDSIAQAVVELDSSTFSKSTTVTTSYFSSETSLADPHPDSAVLLKSFNHHTFVHPARRYALKTIQPSKDPVYIEDALECLKLEATILSSLPRHVNVITLVGVGDGLEQHGGKCPIANGFLVLERIVETLEERFARWRDTGYDITPIASCNKSNKKKSLLRRLVQGGAEDPAQRDRVTRIGLGIARAVHFLHAHRVLFRDLKPGNVGFDGAGNVRLFDFGLARRLPDHDNDTDTGFRLLTARTGTLRFMSPENYMGLPYSYPADVYSFAILLWEIVTLERPFSQVRSSAQLVDVAFTQQKRPTTRTTKISSKRVRELLKVSWDPHPDRRPSFAKIVDALQTEALPTDRRTIRTSFHKQ